MQLRDKVRDTREMIELARAIKAALPADVPLMINDRVDVALAAGADGVHVGQEDMAWSRRGDMLGPAPIIGLSIKTVEQARAAPLGILDYVGIGGVYATTSKDNPSRRSGSTGLRASCGVFRERIGNFPICAIAGIDASQCRAGDRGRRRRRLGDLGAVARARSDRRRARAARHRRRGARRARALA